MSDQVPKKFVAVNMPKTNAQEFKRTQSNKPGDAASDLGGGNVNNEVDMI